MCLNPQNIKIPETDLKIFNSNQRFLTVPCGKCPECRVSHAKEWAVRCMCEYLSLPDNQRGNCWFITFTYNNDYNPGVLRPRDMTLFWKRLRKAFPDNKIKYFYCGEYGSKTYRPHYHAIVYNLPLHILKAYSQNKLGDNTYISPELEKIWGLGYVVVGSLTLRSANYTARYSLKKNDTDCFLRVSHGFGKKYFLDNVNDIVKNGYLTVPSNGGIFKAKIPKYFLKLYRTYLNNDIEYAKFVKSRMDNHNRSTYLDKVFKSKFAWETDPVWKMNAKAICMETKKDKISREMRETINQGLYDLYHKRDF